MEINGESTWLKYERKLLELENRLARNKREPHAAVLYPGRSSYGASSTGEQKDGLVNKLKDEILFLKTELEQTRSEIDEAIRTKQRAEDTARQKDAEILKIFAERKTLENENYSLKLKISKQNFSAMADRSSVHGRRHRKSSLVEWLRKPLIVLEQE